MQEEYPSSQMDIHLQQRYPVWISIEYGCACAIIDLYCPLHVHPDQLKAAAICKQQGYRPLLSALCNYTEKGWTVRAFPWVVGIRVPIDPSLSVSLLTFLDIPSKHSKTAIEGTVLASVKALFFMHQVRFGGMHGRMRAADNLQNDFRDDEVRDDEELLTDPNGQRRNRLARATRRKTAELWYLVQLLGTRLLVEQASPALEHVVTAPKAEEAVISSP
jgi:hypothetical protein